MGYMTLYMRCRCPSARISTVEIVIDGVASISISVFHRDWIRVERCFLRPLRLSPGNNDVADAEGISMLSSEVLNDSLETVEARVGFASASVAQKKLFAELLCQRFQFVIIYPLHVL